MMFELYTSIGNNLILVYFVNRYFFSRIKDLDARLQQATARCQSCAFEDLKRFVFAY